MKRMILNVVVFMLVLTLIVGCGNTQTEQPFNDPTQSTGEQLPTQNNGNDVFNSDSPYVNAAYAQQIGRYFTAVAQKWDEKTCLENSVSALATGYYEGNPLDNVGFAYIDLDGNGVQELIIGAIENAVQNPLVFEIWTLKDDEPVMLVQSDNANRYYLQYAEDDELWSIAYEAERSATNYGVYCLQLFDGELEVSQGVIYDAGADAKNPWFMVYDLDWNVSSDDSVDEDLANAIISASKRLYTSAEYILYSLCK